MTGPNHPAMLGRVRSRSSIEAAEPVVLRLVNGFRTRRESAEPLEPEGPSGSAP
jgi:hypothetical protein